MAEDGRLLQILCLLLGDPIFQCSAAECLLQIVNRKGKAEDRKQLMILFSEDALRYIYTAATTAPPVTGTNEIHENHYLFLKKLTQVNKICLYNRRGIESRKFAPIINFHFQIFIN